MPNRRFYVLALFSISTIFTSLSAYAIQDMILVNSGTPFWIDVFEHSKDGSLTTKSANLESLKDATDECLKSGKRVPTRAEWLLAASNLGVNQHSTLLGDQVEKDGKLLANIRGKNSFPVGEIDKLGIDAIGTVGMTGNRPEWVVDPDGSGAQCGEGYEVKDLSEVELSRICSRKEEGRWGRATATATVRCVSDFKEGDSVQFSSTVENNAELKTAIGNSQNALYKSLGLNDLIEMRASCEKGEHVLSIEDPTLPELKAKYPFLFDSLSKTVLLVTDHDGARPIGYVDCAFFGTSSHTAAASTALAVTPATIKRLQDGKSSASAFYFRDLDTLKSSVKAKGVPQGASEKDLVWIDQEIKQTKLQEAVWRLREIGAVQSADTLEQKLQKIMESDEVVEEKALSSEADITFGSSTPVKYVLTFKSGVKALMSSYCLPFARGGGGVYQADIVASKLDRLLGLNVVPMVIPYTYKGQNGSLMYWIKNAIDGRHEGKMELFPEINPTFTLLDNLIENADSHNGNVLIVQWPDNPRRFIAIDHNVAMDDDFLALRIREGRPIKTFKKMPNRAVHQRLIDLTPEKIQQVFAPILPNAPVVIIRERERILKEAEDILKTSGDAGLYESL